MYMDKKTVNHAVPLQNIPTDYSATIRALRLLVSGSGSITTQEKWIFKALRPLANSGYVNISGSRVSIGNNFDDFLLNASRGSEDYAQLYLEYRTWRANQREELEVTDDSVFESLSHFATTDQQIIYLANLVSELSGTVEALTEIVNNCVSAVNGANISISVLESLVYDADSDQ